VLRLRVTNGNSIALANSYLIAYTFTPHKSVR